MAKMTMRVALPLLLVGMLCANGCRSQRETAANSPGTAASPRPSPVAKSKIDVCSLLTSDELKAVQGEAYQQAQRSDRWEGEFIVAQCYYAMPTTVNSVVINVTTAQDEAGARSPKVLWEQAFGGAKEEKDREGKSEREREKEGGKEPRDRGEEAEAKEARPQRVIGLGDAAFWVASPVGGALYVLKNDMFVRVSVGGSGDQKTKVNKSKTLAQNILKKL
jgi:hypothetical protein